MAITSRCTECGATSLDGVLAHSKGCSAIEPTAFTLESRMPAIEVSFDNPAEQQAFMDKLGGVTDLQPSDVQSQDKGHSKAQKEPTEGV